METLLADLRQALRGMRNNPGFTATAIAALALGIGANTAIFSVVNAVILKPLPYPEPERMAAVQRSFKRGTASSISLPKYAFWKEHNRVFEAITAYDFAGPGLNLSKGSNAEEVQGVHVSSEFFRVFRASPALGRTFSGAEDSPNGPRLVVLGQKLWANRFGSDPAILGKTIDLSGQPYTVIGVMPAGFIAPKEADLWLPLQADPNSTNQAHYLTVTARLRPGVSLNAANAQLKLVMNDFRRAHIDPSLSADEGIKAILLQESIVGDVRPALLILVAAVGFVLLIACANMASLLLARASSRQRELAVRAAIGASQGRLIRQMLTESVLLALIGAGLGLALGLAGVRGLLQVSPGQLPRVEQLAEMSPLAFLDWRIFLYTLATALVTGILFGLFPALRLSRPDLSATLKESSSRSGTGMHQNRARSVLVVGEIAIAIVLLTGAGLLIRTFAGLRNVSTGLDTHNVLTFQTSLADQRFNSSATVDRMSRQMVERIEQIPGVEKAASTWVPPLDGNLDLPFNIVGHTPPKGQKFDGDEYWRPVMPHFFAVYRIPLLRGRLIGDADTATSPPIVIINDVVAKRYWPKEDPIGKQMVIGQGLGKLFEEAPRTIVGVVGGQRENGLGQPASGILYLPAAQVSDALQGFGNPLIPRVWVIRTTANPANVGPAVRSAVHAVDGKLAIAKLRTMDDIMSEYTARENFNMLLLTIFAGIALVLAAVGVYGLISYTVQQRTQEIGIRMALGASKTDTLRLVGRQMLILLGLGLVVGLGASFLVTRYMASLLFEVKPADPVTFGAVAGALILVSLLATALPARRAMLVDPVIALRYE